jgi:hypothetical protein
MHFASRLTFYVLPFYAKYYRVIVSALQSCYNHRALKKQDEDQE